MFVFPCSLGKAEYSPEIMKHYFGVNDHKFTGITLEGLTKCFTCEIISGHQKRKEIKEKNLLKSMAAKFNFVE